MNTLVSLPFITMIPIDCNFFPYICLFAFLNMQVLSGCIETDIKKSYRQSTEEPQDLLSAIFTVQTVYQV